MIGPILLTGPAAGNVGRELLEQGYLVGSSFPENLKGLKKVAVMVKGDPPEGLVERVRELGGGELWHCSLDPAFRKPTIRLEGVVRISQDTWAEAVRAALVAGVGR